MRNVTEFDNPLVRQAASEQELLEQIQTDGQGNAYGLEFSLAYNDLKSFQVEAAYTLSWNWRRFAGFNNGERYPSDFDRRHDLSILINKIFNKGWRVNLVWVYASGRPVTLPSGKLFFPPHFSLSEQLFFDERNNGRLPAYHRMDISISKEKNTKRDNIVRWGISVYNLYNRANPYFVRIGVDAAVNQNGEYEYYRPEIRQVSLLPIVPSAQFALEF